MRAVQLLLTGGEEAISRKDTTREEYIAARLMESSTGEVRLPDMHRDASTWNPSVSGRIRSGR